MMIKLLTRSANASAKQSIKQLVHYVLEYSHGENAPQKEATVLLRHNLAYKNNIQGYIRSFVENESLRLRRLKNNTVLQHAILSFAPDDYGRVTNDILRSVAKKWISLTAPNCLALAVAHKKDNRHIHIVLSGVATDGKSSRLSKSEFASALTHMEAYQAEQFPFLSRSALSHERRLERSKKVPNKEKIKYKLKETLNNILLRTADKISFEPYFRNGRLQGVLYQDKKYRLTTLGLSKTEISILDSYFNRLKHSQNARKKDAVTLTEFSEIRNRKRGLGYPLERT